MILIILLGSLIWSLTMIRSGLMYPSGVGFWGANGHDGVWHLALSESLSRGSFENPVFAGYKLQNYHIGFDLLVAILHRLTTISVTNLYFQVLPLFISTLIGFLVYKFVLLWRKSKNEAFWATFFVYFSSSFGFIVTFIRDRAITGESMFWSQQSISTLINPPFALSLVFILLGLIYLQNKKILLSILCFGFLIQIKAYAAILILGGLFISSVYLYFKYHTTYTLKIFIGSLILNLILFSLVKTDGLSAFIWQPMWYLETMMSYSDRLGWERFYSAMTTYKMGHIWIKGFISYSVAFVIFVIGNMGTRIIGFVFFLNLVKNKIKIDSILSLVIPIMVTAVFIPMFFVQRGTPWNTIQFFYYFLFFASIFAGIALSWSNKLIKIIIIIFSVFGSWATLQHYLPKNPQAVVSKDEIEALTFLSLQPDGIVFTYPFDIYKSKEAIKNPPRPLYFYDSTAYVSAFSRKQIYEADEVNLNIMGYEWKSRRDEIIWFISNLDRNAGKEFLSKNKIKYLYLVKANSPLVGEQLKLGAKDLDLVKIFENKDYIIYTYGENFGSN